jgi:hypothetical protein
LTADSAENQQTISNSINYPWSEKARAKTCAGKNFQVAGRNGHVLFDPSAHAKRGLKCSIFSLQQAANLVYFSAGGFAWPK